MKFLILNCGSSSLKFQVIELASSHSPERRERRLARGLVERIGGEATFSFVGTSGDSVRQTIAIPSHAEAVQQVLQWLNDKPGAEAGKTMLQELDAVGHRIVHGGDRFQTSILIDDEAIEALAALEELAPLHNPPAIRAIRACRAALGASTPMVAAFDTAFHRTLPGYAATYALPYDLAERYRIRRYGFHGLAHRSLALRYAELTGIAREQVTIVTLHLGNGCSACAIRHGVSVDTSMGFTPLEGLVMGTRSGNLDPAVVSYLSQQEGVSAAEVEQWLNERSGLLGVSGRSNDMRELLERAQDEVRCRLAVDLFCYRARQYVGAYLAVLGGAQALIFSGGIGEHSPTIRARICTDMQWCGLSLDATQNAQTIGREGRISSPEARLQAYVIPADEEILIAQDAAQLLHRSPDL
ncbi:MAG TPA: acetate kinase [Alphaproteobacteria bacterium]|nr:acetate kinase [Alphaproteobacteria bacterium]